MTGTATLSIFCPKMPIARVGRKLYRTAPEKMVATIDMPDGSVITIQEVTIPATDVPRAPLDAIPVVAVVDACVGEGQDALGNTLTVNLPEEPVVLDFSTWALVAKAITAPTTLVLADGSVGQGSVVFPDCVTDLFTGGASPVTALGSVVFP